MGWLRVCVRVTVHFACVAHPQLPPHLRDRPVCICAVVAHSSYVGAMCMLWLLCAWCVHAVAGGQVEGGPELGPLINPPVRDYECPAPSPSPTTPPSPTPVPSPTPTIYCDGSNNTLITPSHDPFACEWPPTAAEVELGVVAAMPTLPWTPSSDPEYDVEAAIEFCALPVYVRMPGTPVNGTDTSVITTTVKGSLTSYGFRVPGGVCSSPGPTIVLRPGRRHKMVLRNTLGMDQAAVPQPFMFEGIDTTTQMLLNGEGTPIRCVWASGRWAVTAVA